VYLVGQKCNIYYCNLYFRFIPKAESTKEIDPGNLMFEVKFLNLH
jgi:hypothetical protein